MAIDANKVYHVMNGNATTRRMNLYSSGSVSNGMNVVLYDNDDSNEQKWYFDGERFFPESGTGSSYHKYCLDRYTASTYLNNADIWEATDADAAAQVVEVIKYGYYQRVRLKTKITNADGEEVYYYLTAGANANGTGSGKTAGAAGNVYWAEEITTASQMMRQNWIFTEVGSSVSGGEDDNDYLYEINEVGLPLDDCMPDTYWTTTGDPTDADGTDSKYYNGIQCAGFARYVYAQIWGSDSTGSQFNSDKDYLRATTGQGDLADFPLGTRIVCTVRKSFTPGDANFNNVRTYAHHMILVAKTSTSVTLYHANWDNKCGIAIDTWSNSEFYNRFKEIKGATFIPY